MMAEFDPDLMKSGQSMEQMFLQYYIDKALNRNAFHL